MFIINPYRYAATAPEPITDFFSSIQTSSLSFTLGISFEILSGSIQTGSVDWTIGPIFSPISVSNFLIDTAEFSVGPSGVAYSVSNLVQDTVEIIVT